MTLYRILIALLTLPIFVAMVSCNMRDNFMEQCYEPYLIMVKVDVNDERQGDFSGYEESDISLLREIKDVVLYVFDDNNKYLGCHVTKLNKLTALPYDDFDSIRVVSVCIDRELDKWTNILSVGNYYKSDDVFLQLEKFGVYDTMSLVKSPNDFMFDRKHFGRNPYRNKNVVYYMYVTSKVGAMKIYTSNIKVWADNKYGVTGKENDEFKFVVGSTLDRYDFSGKLKGEYVVYVPNVMTPIENRLNTSMFNMYPTVLKEGVRIEIYRNDELIYPDLKTSKRYSFSISNGWCTNVLMDFDANGDINIDIEEWGDVEINIDL